MNWFTAQHSICIPHKFSRLLTHHNCHGKNGSNIVIAQDLFIDRFVISSFKGCLFFFQTSGACFCNMLLFSIQLVLLKEAHSQTPTMPQGVRVTIKGWQGLNGRLPREAGERVYNGGRKGGREWIHAAPLTEFTCTQQTRLFK